MSGFGNDNRDGGKSIFWKKNSKPFPGSIKPVYGAQHPPLQHELHSEGPNGPSSPKKDLSNNSKSKRDSFTDFETNTSDAWDDGDDDLIMMASVKMSLKDVHSSARAVIDSHARQMRRQDEQIERVRHELSRGDRNDEVAAWLNNHDNNGANHLTDSVPSSHTPISSAISGLTTPPGASPSGPGVGVRLAPPSVPTRASNSLRYHAAAQLSSKPDKEKHKQEKAQALIASDNIDLDELRRTVWSGIPLSLRPTIWKLLSGYLPARIERRHPTLERKRTEYYNYVSDYFHTKKHDLIEPTYRQIQNDLCRMTVLTNRPQVAEIFERILYIWALRHPASGYVQGMNDLVTPFFVVFLSEYIQVDIESEACDLSQLSSAQLNTIEADCYWCFCKLLDGIQADYTIDQPGIQRKIHSLKELIKRVDVTLSDHLEQNNVEFLQFSFRWMNNLLMRELPLQCTIRLWDTYLAEADGFASFHLYVCAGFLLRFSKDLLRQRDFQGLMLMLQNLPTHNWGDEEIEVLLAEAYQLKYMFADAPNHLHPSR